MGTANNDVGVVFERNVHPLTPPTEVTSMHRRAMSWYRLQGSKPTNCNVTPFMLAGVERPV